MRCPQCDEVVSEGYSNPDGTRTCPNCGFTFDPNKEAKWNPPIQDQEEEVVDKMIKKVNGLRSCIVTLQDGKVITLSFPKELEPQGMPTWRRTLKSHLKTMIILQFNVLPPETIVFDDEIGDQPHE